MKGQGEGVQLSNHLSGKCLIGYIRFTHRNRPSDPVYLFSVELLTGNEPYQNTTKTDQQRLMDYSVVEGIDEEGMHIMCEIIKEIKQYMYAHIIVDFLLKNKKEIYTHILSF